MGSVIWYRTQNAFVAAPSKTPYSAVTKLVNSNSINMSNDQYIEGVDQFSPHGTLLGAATRSWHRLGRKVQDKVIYTAALTLSYFLILTEQLRGTNLC